MQELTKKPATMCRSTAYEMMYYPALILNTLKQTNRIIPHTDGRYHMVVGADYKGTVTIIVTTDLVIYSTADILTIDRIIKKLHAVSRIVAIMRIKAKDMANAEQDWERRGRARSFVEWYRKGLLDGFNIVYDGGIELLQHSKLLIHLNSEV